MSCPRCGSLRLEVWPVDHIGRAAYSAGKFVDGSGGGGAAPEAAFGLSIGAVRDGNPGGSLVSGPSHLIPLTNGVFL